MNWTAKDQKRANTQGWGLFEYTGADETEHALVVQRLDDPESIGKKGSQWRFPDDHAAAAYVVGRADMGCELAQKALKCVGTSFRNIGTLRDWNKLVA